MVQDLDPEKTALLARIQTASSAYARRALEVKPRRNPTYEGFDADLQLPVVRTPEGTAIAVWGSVSNATILKEQRLGTIGGSGLKTRIDTVPRTPLPARVEEAATERVFKAPVLFDRLTYPASRELLVAGVLAEPIRLMGITAAWVSYATTGYAEASDPGFEYTLSIFEEYFSRLVNSIQSSGSWTLISELPFEINETVTLSIDVTGSYTIESTNAEPASIVIDARLIKITIDEETQTTTVEPVDPSPFVYFSDSVISASNSSGFSLTNSISLEPGIYAIALSYTLIRGESATAAIDVLGQVFFDPFKFYPPIRRAWIGGNQDELFVGVLYQLRADVFASYQGPLSLAYFVIQPDGTVETVAEGVDRDFSPPDPRPNDIKSTLLLNFEDYLSFGESCAEAAAQEKYANLVGETLYTCDLKEQDLEEEVKGGLVTAELAIQEALPGGGTCQIGEAELQTIEVSELGTFANDPDYFIWGCAPYEEV